MPRLLLLLPTTTYRTQAFLDAARQLGVDVAVASERPSTLERQRPGAMLTLNFRRPEEAAREAARFARVYPVDAVIPVDDDTTVAAAAIAAALGLPHNTVASAYAARNKHEMRRIWRREGLPVPHFSCFSLREDPKAIARAITYPCVVKPLILSASRGVIRADDPNQFLDAFRMIEAILRTEEVIARGGESAEQILVEEFIPGKEVALEGLLTDGQLRVLALFDKPDPLDGPYFEETIYVTPSRLPAPVQETLAACTRRAAWSLGLRHGPIHAELRVNETGPWLLEVAARSIGGLCSRTLRFGIGMSLEELILRHALGFEIESFERDARAAGVMMIPIPRRGVLTEVRGMDRAREVPYIEEVTISAHIGMELIPLPEGSRYLGFIFARADAPERVEAALRQSHDLLEFTIAPVDEHTSGPPRGE